MKTFLTTYRDFSNPTELLDLLIEVRLKPSVDGGGQSFKKKSRRFSSGEATLSIHEKNTVA